MTDLRKAAELALEALEGALYWNDKITDAMEALRQALEQEPWDTTDMAHRAGGLSMEQEPVAWMYVNRDGECEQIEFGTAFDDPSVTLLYTAPPKRGWVGLTDEEEIELDEKYGDDFNAYIDARDAKLKEKNA